MDDALGQPTKHTDFGPVPAYWHIHPLSEVAEVQTGVAKGRKLDSSDILTVPYLRVANVQDGYLDLEEMKHIAIRRDELSRYLLRPGDVVVTEGGDFDKLGRGFVWDGRIQDCIHQNHIFAVRTDRSLLLPEFFSYIIQSSYGKSYFLTVAHKTTNLACINSAKLKAFPVPVPPLSEQQSIADILQGVQKAKEASGKVVSATHQLKQSLMRHLFTYGSVSFDQADQVPLRETDHGPVPQHWDIVPLDECAVVQTGVAKGRKLDSDESFEVPYLRVANVQDGYLDLSEIKNIRIRGSEVDRYSLQPGDVVLTEGGDFDKLGRGFLWNGEVSGCVHQNHIFAVRADRGRLSPEFLAYLTQSHYGKSYFLSVAHKTTNLACINTAKLKALPVPIPPPTEQEEIVRCLAAADRKAKLEEERKSALDTLFKSLLHNLMTGKVRIGEVAVPA